LITVPIGSTASAGTWIYTINLPPPNFNLGLSSSMLFLDPGSQVSVSLTVTPQNGFNSLVSFTCSGLPSGATCSFSPTTVTPSGGNAATTQLIISVSASSASALPASKRNRDSLFPGAALALTDVLFAFARRRSLRGSLYLIIALGMLAGIAACGGGGAANGSGGSNRGGVNRVTSLVTVTATSGSIQQTASITLTVN
jgi:hypothetical protein